MKMKPMLLAVLLLAAMLTGCAAPKQAAEHITATTLPVYQFTSILCEGTSITVNRLVSESVSCLHDYSLSVSQVKAVESAKIVITSGAGLEDFMSDILANKNVVDASEGIALLGASHDEKDADHHHEHDPHIWLSPANAMVMADNICKALKENYPEHADVFEANLKKLHQKLQELLDYGKQTLAELKCRDMITFHDGFHYFAQAFDLNILAAVEEESGSEASSQELIKLIDLVKTHNLPAVFIEENGSSAAAKVISSETGAAIHTLSMAMSGDDYFAAMYKNIDTVREALG